MKVTVVGGCVVGRVVGSRTDFLQNLPAMGYCACLDTKRGVKNAKYKASLL